MIVGPAIETPMPPTWGAPASANSSLRMNCSMVLSPAPPYSFGHAGAIQPRSSQLLAPLAHGAALQLEAGAAAGAVAVRCLAALVAAKGASLRRLRCGTRRLRGTRDLGAMLLLLVCR